MNKKILVLPSWYPNVNNEDGSFFREQAAFLNANGYDIRVLMIIEIHTKNYFFQKLKRLLVLKRIGLSKNWLLQDPEAYSYPVIIQKSWSIQRKIRVIKQGYLKAYKLIVSNGWQPDLIHVQSIFKAGFGANAIKETFGIPYVLIEHSPFKETMYFSILMKEVKSSLVGAAKIAGVSHYQSHKLKKYVPETFVMTVWNLLDEERFIINEKRDLTSFNIITVLRPVKVKDPLTFLLAIKDLLTLCGFEHKLQITIVGLSGLDDLLVMNNIDSKVLEQFSSIEHEFKFIASCDRQTMFELISESNVMVATSRDEPYGLAIREAMLCGTNVISTRSGGPEDSIDDSTGILVELGDYKAISKSLYQLILKQICFNQLDLRKKVIGQSGRMAYLGCMNDFYTLEP